MSSVDKNRKVVCLDKDGNEFEVLASELIMRPSIYGVIIQDGKILLAKQWDGYDFPGGGIDRGETNVEALIREIKEETGMDAEVGELVSCESSFYKASDGKYYHSILIYHLCEIVGGEFSIDGIDEAEKAYMGMPEWISLEDRERIKFYNSVDSLQVIRRAMAIKEEMRRGAD